MRKAGMKKYLIMLLCAFALLLSACGKPQEAPPEPTPTPVPTAAPTPTPVPTPATTAAKVRVLKAPAVIAVLERGTDVTITGEKDGYYIVDCSAGSGLIEKRLLATETDKKFEEWKGYACYGAKLYSSYRLNGKPVSELNMNDEMTVLADLDGVYLVDFNGTKGYVQSDMVSSTQIAYYYYGGGGDGGSGDGGGGAPAGGADGGDISLGYRVDSTPALTFLTSTSTPVAMSGSKAQVISLQAELIAAFYSMGDEVRVVSTDGKACTLYIDGVYAQMEKRFLLLDGETADTPKEVYVNCMSNLYDNYYLLLNDSVKQLGLNDKLTILADMEDCWFVSTADGSYGYIEKEKVSDTPITYYGGGYGGGDSGGGGGGGGSEWTEPTL